MPEGLLPLPQRCGEVLRLREWLRYVIDHFLRPGAEARRSGLACFEGSTFDHACNGIVAVERRDLRELSLLHVHDNTVEVEVLVPGERVPW